MLLLLLVLVLVLWSIPQSLARPLLLSLKSIDVLEESLREALASVLGVGHISYC
jgi:hypothetical protein